MPLHDSNVLAMVYSHDLDALITASQDTTIRVHWHNLRFVLPLPAFFMHSSSWLATAVSSPNTDFWLHLMTLHVLCSIYCAASTVQHLL